MPMPDPGNIDFPEGVVLLAGNEGRGLPKEVVARCDAVTFVPQTGPVGSLNLAVACSIALYEYSKQHGKVRNIDGSKFADSH